MTAAAPSSPCSGSAAASARANGGPTREGAVLAGPFGPEQCRAHELSQPGSSPAGPVPRRRLAGFGRHVDQPSICHDREHVERASGPQADGGHRLPAGQGNETGRHLRWRYHDLGAVRVAQQEPAAPAERGHIAQHDRPRVG